MNRLIRQILCWLGETGERSEEFARHLTWSGMGYVIASALLYGIFIIAGRWLGPTEFGRWGIVFALAQFLQIPMLLGMHVAVAHSVSRASATEHSRVIGSALGLAGLASTGVAAMVFIFSRSSFIVHVFQFTNLLIPAFLLALSLGARALLDGVIRGQKEFTWQAWVRVIDALCVAIVFATIMVVSESRTWSALAWAWGIGSFVAVLLYAARVIRTTERLQYSWPVAQSLWRYIRFGLVGSIGGIFLVSSDKMLVGHFLGEMTLGIYTAYYTVTMQVGDQLSFIFINVLFPWTSGLRDPRVIQKRLERALRKLLIPLWMSIAFIASVGLLLLSTKQYPWEPLFLVAMTVVGTAYFAWQSYWWFISGTGRTGVRTTGMGSLIIGIGYSALLFLLLPRLELWSIPVAFGLVMIVALAIISQWKQRF